MSDGVWFDRTPLLDQLRRKTEGFRSGYRQNVALLGEEGIGKSALLRRLTEGFSTGHPDFLPVYLELDESDNLVEWVTRFMQTLLYGALQVRGCDPLPTQWTGLLESCASWSPRVAHSAQRILDGADGGKSDQAYQQCWDLLPMISNDLGCRVLIILDEFHRLRCLPVTDPFRVLGGKVMVQNSTMFLMASSQIDAAQSILREGLALLFGQFEVVGMQPLSSGTCLREIQSAWTSSRREPFYDYFLAELGQGYPDHLQRLAHGVRRQLSENPTMDAEEVVLRVMESLLWSPSAVFRARFESRLRSLPEQRNRLACIHLLVAVAQGKCRIPQMVEATGRKSTQVARFLKVLEQSRCVQRDGAFYRVPDRLFQLWLIAAYPAITGVGRADVRQGKVYFRQEALRWIRRSGEEFRQPLVQRVERCLRSWNGEQLQFEGQRFLLPALKQIEIRSLRGGGDAVLTTKGLGQAKRGWRIVLRMVDLSETQARQMAEEVSSLPGARTDRKVLIVLRPVEVNARLVLQQAKFKIWDLEFLNHLFELYGMTRIPDDEQGNPSGEMVPVDAPSTPFGSAAAQRGTEAAG